MSFGLSHGKPTDITGSWLTRDDLPPLPADIDNPATLAGPPEAVKDPARAHIDIAGFFKHPDRPLELEIGSGKGTFLAQQAPLQPDTNFLGIEYAGEFFRYAADRIRRAQLGNVRMLYTDAQVFLRWRVPDRSLRVLHLYFADPWPKARHHKRRTVQDQFFKDAHRALQPGGELRIVTDHDDYWAWMEEHFERCVEGGSAAGTGEHPVLFTRHEFVSPESAAQGEVVGTNFERKYRVEGRTFNAATLRKLDAPVSD